MLQIIAEHGQVVYRAEGGWVLEFQRQAVVEKVLAGLVGGEGGIFFVVNFNIQFAKVVAFKFDKTQRLICHME